jgi:hypothetical protein
MDAEETTLNEALTSESPPSEEKESPKKPSPLGRLFTKVVRWTAGIVMIFAFGVALTWLVRVAPLVRDLNDVREDLATASAEIDRLELAAEGIPALEQSNVALQAELTAAEQHLNILKILSDVSTSRLALANDNSAAALSVLVGTDERMSRLQESLEGEDANSIVGLRVRLQQAISEIDTNMFAADGDLGILANDLLSLERKLYDN